MRGADFSAWVGVLAVVAIASELFVAAMFQTPSFIVPFLVPIIRFIKFECFFTGSGFWPVAALWIQIG